MIQFNFSGRAIPGYDIQPCVGINFSSLGEELHQMIRKLVLDLPRRDDLIAGRSAEIILPGQSHAAAVLLAEWHGQFGNWPNIRWAIKDDSGFQYPDAAACDLNDVRASARTAR